jgi:hypothetical protein
MFDEKVPSVAGFLLGRGVPQGIGKQTADLNLFGDEDESCEAREEDDRGDEDFVFGVGPFLVVFGVDYFEEGILA